LFFIAAGIELAAKSFKFLPVLKTNFIAIIISVISVLFFSFSVPVTEGLTEDVLKYTNQFRKSKGLPALEMRKELNAVARTHSEDMARGRRSFGHGGYNQRESQVKKIIKPYGAMAENVAYGARNGKEVFEIWKNSSGHKKNMLGNYKYIGIGTARNKRGVIYYTQIFVR
jgi:uncharacterized protein YkwD